MGGGGGGGGETKLSSQPPHANIIMYIDIYMHEHSIKNTKILVIFALITK